MGYEKCLLGYPISDESSTPDGVGRFNRFQNGMIYWTPKTGAFEVHGSILAKWSSIGYEKSPLGYPISDESAAIENGRMSTFEHGQIYYWGNIGAIVNMGAPLSSKSAITVHLSGPIIFPDGVAITSAYNIAITPAGDISASIHAHCSSEVVTYDYGVVILLTTPNGLTVGVQHSGHVSNPIIGSANNDDWTANRNEPIISRNYSQFMQASVAHISKTADTEIFGQSLNDLLQQALQAAGKAAVTFLLA
ncbi:MAG: LGFP repeat-containing protein [Janthinobacterium lividum]